MALVVAMRVLVLGGTGFVGPAIVRAIAARGHDVTVLVHRRAGPFESPPPRVRLARGDATDAASYREAAGGHDAVVNLVAIRRAFPRKRLTFERLHTGVARAAVDVAKSVGARRFLQMSASGVKPDGTDYQRTKWESEDIVKSSGLGWTVFRPTFVTGKGEAGARGFDEEFAGIVRKAPVLPAFGGGRFPIQPVARADVARAFAAALDTPKAVGKTYFLAGPDRLTWNEYLRTLARALGKRRVIVPVPRWFILPIARLLGRFAWFPASRDELVMLMEGAAGDATEAAQDLGVEFTPFRDALAEVIAPAVGARGVAR